MGAFAEDLAAETFTRAFAGRSGYDLARGRAAVAVRHRHQRPARPPARRLLAALRPSARAETFDADDRLDAAAALARYAAALRALTVEQREVLLLVAVGELTYEETAEALGIPVGTVRSRMSRARAALAPVAEETPSDPVRLERSLREETKMHGWAASPRCACSSASRVFSPARRSTPDAARRALPRHGDLPGVRVDADALPTPARSSPQADVDGSRYRVTMEFDPARAV